MRGVRIGTVTQRVDPTARAELRRQQRARVANLSGWPELERRHLVAGPFRGLTDERDGSQYTVARGEIDVNSANVVAFYFEADQEIVFLEAKR